MQLTVDLLLLLCLQRFGLDHFQGSFIILGAGLVLSAAAFAYEVLVKRKTEHL